MFSQSPKPKNSIELESIPEQMNFSYSFKPLFFLSWICGHFPFTIVRNQSDIIIGCCVGAFDIVLFILNISLNMIVAGICFPIAAFPETNLMDFVNATTHLSVTGNNLFLFGQNIITVISIVLNLLNRNRFIEIFKAFDVFDKEVYF